MSLTALWLLVSDTLESLKLYLHEQQAQHNTPLKKYSKDQQSKHPRQLHPSNHCDTYIPLVVQSILANCCVVTSTHAPAVVGNGIQIVHGWIRWINRTHNIIRQIQTLDRKVDKVADLFPTNTIPANQPTLASTDVQSNNTTKTEFDDTIPVQYL